MFRSHGISWLLLLYWLLLSLPLHAGKLAHCLDLISCKNLFWKAWPLEQAGKYQEALAIYKEADYEYEKAQSGQHHPEILKRIADMYKKLGQFKQACAQYIQIQQSADLDWQDRAEIYASIAQIGNCSNAPLNLLPATKKIVPIPRVNILRTQPIQPHSSVSTSIQNYTFNFGGSQQSLAPAVGPIAKEASHSSSISPAGTVPLYKQWWLWTVVGAGAIGIITVASVAGRDTRPIYVW